MVASEPYSASTINPFIQRVALRFQGWTFIKMLGLNFGYQGPPGMLIINDITHSTREKTLLRDRIKTRNFERISESHALI